MDIEHLIADKICIIDSFIINRRYNHKGHAVYMVAALGVMLDPETNEMKVFGGTETKMVAKNVADDSKYHMDDILSMDISSDRKLAVTG
jgi:hypothetical protein